MNSQTEVRSNSSKFRVRKCGDLEGLSTAVAWNDSRNRFASSDVNGWIQIWDREEEASSSFHPVFKFQEENKYITQLIWCPLEFGNKLAVLSHSPPSTSSSSSSSPPSFVTIWNESKGNDGKIEWCKCSEIKEVSEKVLSISFGRYASNLLLLLACSNGCLYFFESKNILELNDFKIQAEVSLFPFLEKDKIFCKSMSVCWKRSFLDLDVPLFFVSVKTKPADVDNVDADVEEDANAMEDDEGDVDTTNQNLMNARATSGIAQVWGFDSGLGRWKMMADVWDKGKNVFAINHVAWANNIGRSFELLAIGSSKNISIWKLSSNSNSNSDEKLSMDRVALLTDHDCEVIQVEFDASGSCLASSDAGGKIIIWKPMLGGVWTKSAVIK